MFVFHFLVFPNRPTSVSLPGSLKNNSAITVISKSSRGGMQKVLTRPPILPKKIGTPIRPLVGGPRIIDSKVRHLNSNLQVRPYSLIRGRAPFPRNSRPIPIQNNLNIKIQGPNPHQSPNMNLDSKENYKDFDKELSDQDFDSNIDSSEFNMPINTIDPADMMGDTVKIEGEFSESSSRNEQDDVEKLNSEMMSSHPQSSLSEDVISEDSSQERTYVDLSDKSESKITTKLTNKKNSPTSINMFKDCNIHIKNSGFIPSSVDMGFMNSNITIKRTNPSLSSIPSSTMIKEIPQSSPVHSVSESCTSESISDYKMLVSQNSASSDENMFDGDMPIKEKRNYRPNLIDRKVSSLKNYRHQKFMQKPIHIQNMDLQMDKASPGSTSSTPTPPPLGAFPIQTNAKVIPDRFESSLSQLEKAATSFTRSPKKGGVSDFQQSLSDITRTHPLNVEANVVEPIPYKPGPKSRKKKTPPASRIESHIPDDESVTSSSSERNDNKLNTTLNVDPSQTSSSSVHSVPNTPIANFNQASSSYNTLSDSAVAPAGFADSLYQQQQQTPVSEPILPQQPYNSYPGKEV